MAGTEDEERRERTGQVLSFRSVGYLLSRAGVRFESLLILDDLVRLIDYVYAAEKAEDLFSGFKPQPKQLRAVLQLMINFEAFRYQNDVWALDPEFPPESEAASPRLMLCRV